MFNVAFSDPKPSNKISRPGAPWSLANAPTYLAGLVGTILAGGVFGSGLVSFVALTSPGARGEASFAILLSFVVGSALAGFSAIFVFPVFRVIQHLVGLNEWSAVLASCAGGWSGFAAVVVSMPHDAHDEVLFVALVAMAIGQAGAALAAYRTNGWKAMVEQRRGSVRHAQFTLRQLFGLTTTIATLVAIVSSFQLPPTAYEAMGVGLIGQSVFVGIWLLARRAEGARFT